MQADAPAIAPAAPPAESVIASPPRLVPDGPDCAPVEALAPAVVDAASLVAPVAVVAELSEPLPQGWESLDDTDDTQ